MSNIYACSLIDKLVCNVPLPKLEVVEQPTTKKIKDITFHYTNEQMVIDLLADSPIDINDSVLDAGSGLNKVWYNNLPNQDKYECELEDGCDFLEWNQRVDWVIGNPPFSIGYKFLLHAATIVNKGIIFLLNFNGLNSSFTPKRLDTLKTNDLSLKSIVVCQDKRWYGRYYLVTFTKENNNVISWIRKVY